MGGQAGENAGVVAVSAVLWSTPATDGTEAFSETGVELVMVAPDGSLSVADNTGVTVHLGPGAAEAVLSCLARARGLRDYWRLRETP